MDMNWKQQIASLEANKYKIEKQINLLRNLVSLEDEHSENDFSDEPTPNYHIVANATNEAPKRQRKNEKVESVKSMKLPAVLVQIGQQHPQAMTYQRFVELVKDTGYKSNSNNFSNMIYQCLNKLVSKGQFYKNGETKEYQFTGKID